MSDRDREHHENAKDEKPAPIGNTGLCRVYGGAVSGTSAPDPRVGGSRGR